MPRPRLGAGRCAVMPEHRLAGGNTGGAVRVGDTVRRVPGGWTPSVHALLRHLQAVGFTGCPRVHGFDDQGREVLSYLPGEVVGTARPWPVWVHSDDALCQIASWLRDFQARVSASAEGIRRVAATGDRPTGTWSTGVWTRRLDARCRAGMGQSYRHRGTTDRVRSTETGRPARCPATARGGDSYSMSGTERRPATRWMVASPSGVPGQCRSRASTPARRVTQRSAIATMIASSA